MGWFVVGTGIAGYLGAGIGSTLLIADRNDGIREDTLALGSLVLLWPLVMVFFVVLGILGALGWVVAKLGGP